MVFDIKKKYYFGGTPPIPGVSYWGSFAPCGSHLIKHILVVIDSYCYSLEVRARSLFWQRLLRRSVGLYLALAHAAAPVHVLERAQRKVERRLLSYLVRHPRRTPTLLHEARAVLERAQMQLLGDAAARRSYAAPLG